MTCTAELANLIEAESQYQMLVSAGSKKSRKQFLRMGWAKNIFSQTGGR